MRSPKNESLKLLSLAAVLAGAAWMAGCGGGGEVAKGTTVVVNGPVALPAAPPPLPDPIPMPPLDGGGTVFPPADPIDPVPGPVVDVPALAPDLAQVHALAVVGQEKYVGDAAGNVWQLSPEGTQWAMFATTEYGAIEAMTYVGPKNALYMVQGGRLTRLPLDTRVIEVLPTSDPFDMDFIPNYFDVTGLAFNPLNHRLYGLDRQQHRLFRFFDLNLDLADLDVGWDMFLGFAHDDLGDLAFDPTEPPGALIAVDTTGQVLIEIDHLGLTWTESGTIAYSGVRALALELPGQLVAVDNSWQALVRFELDGQSIP